MGLVKTFESVVMPFSTTLDDDDYHPELITAPRIYREEPESYGGASPKLGCLWSLPQETVNGPSVVCFFSVMHMTEYPSWSGRLWTVDGTNGELISSRLGASVFGGGDLPSISFDGISWEPQGHLWEYSGSPFIDEDGAVVLDLDTFSPVAGGVLGIDAFGREDDRIEAFAIDRRPGYDRVFVRWMNDANGLIRVYRASTFEELTQVYTAGKVLQLVVSNDGFLYAMDVADWIHIYSFDGKYRGSLRHPKTDTYPGGVAWGWDAHYKRLLRVAGTALETDGGSTLKVEGFYPVPEAMILSPAIPRDVPRKGRTVYSFAHLCGEGAEPIAGRRVIGTGGAVGTFLTDAQGDTAIRLKPNAEGTLTIGLEVPE